MMKTIPLLSFIRSAVLVIFVLSLLAGTISAQQSAKFRTLYDFTGGTDGANPWGGVIKSHGNLYGANCDHGVDGDGVVFEVGKKGREITLHGFLGSPDGADSFAPVIRDSEGNLYGTTTEGGTYGGGTVFEIDSTGTETVLYSFTGGSNDGSIPYSGLLEYAGDLYGNTWVGGAFDEGTIFKLTKTGEETVLHSFSGGSNDGAYPMYSSLAVKDGALYGVTESGGNFGSGTVYKITTEGKFSVLYSFAGGRSDGCSPVGAPAFDASGNIYGTAENCGKFYYGNLWKLSPSGKETILHTFPDGAGDGRYPWSGVAFDANGNLYGATPSGGHPDDAGTIFELSKDGTYTVLHRFTNYDGTGPNGQVFVDPKGHLYGTTFLGGTHGQGTVWEYSP
jgi:uncharacterized repeat protein (TIGR03803 family)